MVRRKLRDEADARSCLARAARSQQGRAEWARRNGVDVRSLNMWRVMLERSGAETPSAAVRMVELVAA